MNIAIDGPAGAGKSSIAKLVAKEMDFIYVDTGAMFRAMAYYFLSSGIDTQDEEAVSAGCPSIRIRIEYQEGVQHIFLNDTDVSSEIRKEEVGKNASVVAKYPEVRTKLLELQRAMADLDRIEADIIARYEQDMNREIAPLRAADDAVLVDTSYMTIPEVVAAIREIAESKR